MYHLVIDRVTKSFGNFNALDNVSLHVHKNSIHAILGENGAGKTTLMNVLYGLYHPDEGRIEIDGRKVLIDNPRRAIENSIGMIHQHFMLVKSLTVTENIILGLKGQKASLRLSEHEQRVRELSDAFGFEIDPQELVWKLPMGMRQRVEILKALYRNVELLILDEPTSVLAPHEVDAFLSGLKRLRDAGHTIIFITHKLDEVMQAADQVTVLRQGRVTAETAVADTTVNELARLMVGRDVIFDFVRSEGKIGEVALEVENLCASNDRGIRALDRVSFALRSGEILGIAGVDGNGQAELAEVITGMRPLEAGFIRVYGQDISGAGIRERMQIHEIGFIPEDRQNTGLVLDYPVTDNLALRSFNCAPFSRAGFMSAKFLQAHAREIVQKYDVRLQTIRQPALFLSGGNQQKIILGRELEADPKILVAMQPTKGLDVGAIEFVQKMILQQRHSGKAVLYISTELEHLLAVSDRIAVMFGGRITGILQPGEATAEQIGMLMSGVRQGSV
ncbi:MAG: ABC transporter ATP-binding protein [Desulfobacterales bacterium]|nr:MAG: ABC transporter ATP-binding protein [Desulfobacterales bacterium]